MSRLSIFLLGAVAFAAVGCGGPRVVPDRELALIFHDIFLVNTYVGQRGLNIDSLNIYEPVFATHGYTIEDIQYTIGSFAKRKSARLSDDVVAIASDMLKAESGRLSALVRLRGTLADEARRRTARRELLVPRMEVRRVADTALLRAAVEDVRPGSYEVSWSYTVDSLDRNGDLRAQVWLVDGAGRRSGNQSRVLERGGRQRIALELAAGGEHRRLVIDLNGYRGRVTAPRMSVDSLTVTYLLPEREAMAAFVRALWGAADSVLAASPRPYYNDIFKHYDETHLGAPAVDPPGTAARQGGDAL